MCVWWGAYNMFTLLDADIPTFFIHPHPFWFSFS